jgi:hypothetical protein
MVTNLFRKSTSEHTPVSQFNSFRGHSSEKSINSSVS